MIQNKEQDVDNHLAQKQSALFKKIRNTLNLKNDAALARLLEVSTPVISKMKHGKLPIGTTLLVSIHEETGWSSKQIKAELGIAVMPSGVSLEDLEEVNVRDLLEGQSKSKNVLAFNRHIASLALEEIRRLDVALASAKISATNKEYVKLKESLKKLNIINDEIQASFSSLGSETEI